MATRPNAVLSVAGVDSGGGAGIAADLKTFWAYGLWGTVAVTAVTAQNTLRVTAIEPVSPALLTAQMRAVLEDFSVAAVKVGMVPNRSLADAIVAVLGERGEPIPVVWDPVLVASSGDRLGTQEAVWTAVRSGHVWLLTPNLEEAGALVGRPLRTRQDMAAAAAELAACGAQAVLIKGGHLPGDEAADYLWDADGGTWWVSPRLPAQPTHGTGCTLSSAIAAGLARGLGLREAVERARGFVREAILAQRPVGQGRWPVDPGWGCTPWI
ncbi:MAG: bifunctional hydroxymethylpyrimidine kinase/phosphomethylpyrimidine kinase [Firmicutes bacterium]|nr:bifunctional hydroxymethylpyrimidine kinase/phosphomethylpyrimidine kinase [Alicyclobacillaceae bacterium]MCL6497565.1 bifunctional hydroxymethylpyrimidine kinase/phosphomethylpyrimidine kinase [Bacillota bacterium]